MTKLLLTAALLACAGSPLAAQAAKAPFTIAGTSRSFYRLQDAVNVIGTGSATITIAPGTYGDCAIVSGGRVAFVAATSGTAIFDGGTCAGKATLVLAGQEAVVQGLVFRNIHVPDHNGAGIRLEKGNLTVADSSFRDSEQGILTAADRAATVRITHSTFSGLGTCEGAGGCAHGVYIGLSGALEIEDSRFERGRGGHYVKSRAARVSIVDSSFDDSKGKATNYMIDLPAGATGRITGNEFVQGTDKENHSAFITVAPEGHENPSAGLVVANNRASLAPGTPWRTVFVADWSHEPLKVGPNQLGPGITPVEIRN